MEATAKQVVNPETQLILSHLALQERLRLLEERHPRPLDSHSLPLVQQLHAPEPRRIHLNVRFQMLQ
jgi:hypothetical protein